MRSEQEIMSLILDTAQKDERIRAVYFNGSRTNSNTVKDIFQDYDIVYVVNEISSFIKDEKWVNQFGNLLMMQEPEKVERLTNIEMNSDKSYGFLMLFKDGNRIDLHLETKESMLDRYGKDKLTIPLLDKENCLPQISAPTDIDYHVKQPSELDFEACCNEFWWCLQNVAKGIWRDELPYAKQMYERPVRDALDEMVSYWIGANNNFQVSTGKMGKYFKKHLPHSYWEMYKETYSDGNYENMWISIFVACDLFRTLAKSVAQSLEYAYLSDDDNNMTSYLKHVRKLPVNVKEIS